MKGKNKSKTPIIACVWSYGRFSLCVWSILWLILFFWWCLSSPSLLFPNEYAYVENIYVLVFESYFLVAGSDCNSRKAFSDWLYCALAYLTHCLFWFEWKISLLIKYVLRYQYKHDLLYECIQCMVGSKWSRMYITYINCSRR